VNLCVCICESLYVRIFYSLCLHVWIFVFVFVSLSVHIFESLCISESLCLHLWVSLCTFLNLCAFLNLCVCICKTLSMCTFVNLRVCISESVHFWIFVFAFLSLTLCAFAIIGTNLTPYVFDMEDMSLVITTFSFSAQHGGKTHSLQKFLPKEKQSRANPKIFYSISSIIEWCPVLVK